MPEFSIRVEHLNEVLSQLDKLPDHLEKYVTRGLKIAAANAVEQIQQEIATAYPPESLPYMPPHARTGALMRSARISAVEPLRVTVSVGGEDTFVPYAQYLEFGTSKMTERPFVRPIVERITPEVDDIVLEEVNKGLPEALR